MSANVAEWEAAFAEAAERAGRVVTGVSHSRSGSPAAGGGVVAGSGGARARTVVPRPLAPPPAPSGDGPGSKPRRGLFRRRAAR